MKRHTLNVELSQEVFEQFKDCIEPKMCYNNVFSVFDMNNKVFREGKWKIAYGYVEVMAGLYCRHCFILDESGTVVDPTLFVQSKPPLEREYYVMYVFEDVDEYLTAIEENDLLPALDKYLREQDRRAQGWARDNGVIFVG